MHLYFTIRGIRQSIESFEKFMQTQMFPWKRINLETGKEEISMVQGAYRDAGPFKEYIFPEECLEEVLEMMGYFKGDMKEWGISEFKNFLIRKFLGNGVRKIPKEIKTPLGIGVLGFVTQNSDGTQSFLKYRFIERRGVVIDFIGIKDDERKDAWGYNQEML